MSDTSYRDTGDSPSDPSAAGPVSEEQAQEYLARLRSAPAEQILTEVLSILVNAAQVKLGRRDARLMIDASAVLFEHARGYLSGDLAGQLDAAFAQLRLEQVRAESAAGEQRESEPNDLVEPPEPPASGADPETGGYATGDTRGPATSPPPPRSGPSRSRPAPPPGSGLWIPGRDF